VLLVLLKCKHISGRYPPLVTDATRALYRVLEPLHSLQYFAQESEHELTALGLRPGRMAYLAARSAAMGAVGAGVVTATFYNFNPEVVARHLPRAWSIAAPEQVLAARLRAAENALRRLLGAAADSADIAECAALAHRAAAACSPQGRPLFAAHADLDVPSSDLGSLWHAVTLLREFRGDGHVVALVAAGLSGLEALVTHTATGRGFVPTFATASRGWSGEQWEAAAEGLRGRGVLDEQGRLTEEGVALRSHLESETDRLSAAPLATLTDAEVARLTELGASLTRRVLAARAFPQDVFATG